MRMSEKCHNKKNNKQNNNKHNNNNSDNPLTSLQTDGGKNTPLVSIGLLHSLNILSKLEPNLGHEII